MPDEFTDALAPSVAATLDFIEHVMGGARQPEPCTGRDLGTVADRAPAFERDHTAHCDQRARFALPYEREDGGTGVLTACAVDDLAGLWPALATDGWL